MTAARPAGPLLLLLARRGSACSAYHVPRQRVRSVCSLCLWLGAVHKASGRIGQAYDRRVKRTGYGKQRQGAPALPREATVSRTGYRERAAMPTQAAPTCPRCLGKRLHSGDIRGQL